jgi:hypothetical protein
VGPYVNGDVRAIDVSGWGNGLPRRRLHSRQVLACRRRRAGRRPNSDLGVCAIATAAGFVGLCGEFTGVWGRPRNRASDSSTAENGQLNCTGSEDAGCRSCPFCLIEISQQLWRRHSAHWASHKRSCPTPLWLLYRMR